MDTQDLQKYVGEKIETISLEDNVVEITFESGEKMSIVGRDDAARW